VLTLAFTPGWRETEIPHTVQSLSKLLKKTEEEVITILANAGIEGKAADSEMSGEERKVLMSSLSKRSSKSSISVSRLAFASESFLCA
jgi:translation initiation factor IF-2